MLNNILATVLLVLMFATLGFAAKAGINKCQSYNGTNEYRECLGI